MDNNISKKIYLDRLFPKINNANIQNLLIDVDSVSYITTPIESKKIAEIISNHMSKYKTSNECVIVDGTAGVGGDSIMLSTMFEKVISIEIDQQRFEYLKHNIKEYGIKNIFVLNGNSTDIIPKLSNVDVIYVDPPWGGKNYKLKKYLRLNIGNVSIENFVELCFSMISFPKIIAFKLPKNYDLKYMYLQLNTNYNIYLYQLKKINMILIEKK